MTFEELELDDALCHAAADMGFEAPTNIQELVIPHALDGRDILASAPTGTGKTAAFLLPACQFLLDYPRKQPGATRILILTPTRELALQVYEQAVAITKHTQLVCGVITGGINYGTDKETLSKNLDILVATPGRLLEHIEKEAADCRDIECLILDEADRMLDMGFIDEIKRILRHIPGDRQTLLFSATFDDSVFELSKKLLKNPELIEVDKRNSAAVEVEQVIYAVDEERKRELVSHMIGMKNWRQVLIFTRTKQMADKLAKEMCKDGLKTESIHGDKSQGARDRALQNFKEGTTRVLVATDVAARGLDIPALKYVINFELPYIAEDYVHRIGRTGRAGEQGLAMSLVSIDEQWLLEEIEVLLDTRLAPQWLEGYEPDLNKPPKDNRKNTNKARKDRDKKRITGQRAPSKRRRK